MGSLNLPESGPVYLDANGFIYSVERLEPYAEFLTPLWEAQDTRRDPCSLGTGRGKHASRHQRPTLSSSDRPSSHCHE